MKRTVPAPASSLPAGQAVEALDAAQRVQEGYSIVSKQCKQQLVKYPEKCLSHRH